MNAKELEALVATFMATDYNEPFVFTAAKGTGETIAHRMRVYISRARKKVKVAGMVPVDFRMITGSIVINPDDEEKETVTLYKRKRGDIDTDTVTDIAKAFAIPGVRMQGINVDDYVEDK